MIESGKGFQLNKKQTDILFYGSLVCLALFAFLCIGSREPILFDDSGSYMRIERIEGVMPVYPFFLLWNQYLFGDRYLDIVIIEQAVIATVCVVLFVREIRNQFALLYREGYLVFFLALLPFTTELPEAMMTQTILTEGLAYALFYLFMICLLRTVIGKRYRFLAVSFVIVFLLAMLRSQLQILFGVCGIVVLYLTWKRGNTPAGRLTGLLLGIMGCALISVAGIWITAKAVNGYHYLIKDNIKFNVFVMKVQDPDYYIKFSTNEDGGIKESGEVEEAIQNKQVIETTARRPIITSQYTSLLFSRGMYEADAEDIALYQDEMIRGLYSVSYDAVDRERQRYIYEQKGLWIWKDIVGGIGRAGKTCLPVGNQYYQENYPEIYESDSFNEVWNRSLQTIGIELLKRHFGRFVYHSVMLLPQAFICTVFFQIRSVYLLCHLVTLFLYLSALALMVWGYADRKAEKKYAEFMALVLGSNVVMVAVISLVFFGQQRYLVYNFGIFYIAYYLLLRELWKCHIHDWAKKLLAGCKDKKQSAGC